MSFNQRIAIVTGGNKGIGYAIVKGLCETFKGKVYLTSRNISNGKNALETLNSVGLEPSFHQLDIDDDESVTKFRDYIKESYGGIDILVNNAAVAFSNNSAEPFHYQAKSTLKTNYFGLLRVSDALFPLLNTNAVVVNVSSSAGHLSRIPSEDIRKKISDPLLSVSQLNDLMNQFISDSKTGSHVEKGWGNSAYVVSKVGVTALTVIQQREFDEHEINKNISVNAVHPGYVNTDMTGHKGELTIEEGAKAPLYLALQQHGLKGKFVWFDCTVVDWLAPSPPTKKF